MGFKERGGAKQYRAWKNWSAGDFVIGKYTDTGSQTGDYGEQNWYDVAITESNFNIDKSQTLRLNGNGALDHRMEGIDVNSTIKVQYDGISQLKKGKFAGRDFHDIRVFVDEDEAATTEEPSEDYSGL